MSNSSTKKLYLKKIHNLEDKAQVIIISNYVQNNDILFKELKDNIPWKHFNYEIYGKEVQSPRLMNIIYLDTDYDLPNFDIIKKRVEKMTNKTFNYAVLNYYRNGNDYIAFHSDSEVKENQIVVSVSVGATRRFVLKHKFRGVKHIFMLRDGDVMILNEEAIKSIYKHSIPKMANVGPRINITFRE